MDFSDLNNIDYLKTHQDETNRLWYDLLKFLDEDTGNLNNSIETTTDPFSFIEETTDLPDTKGEKSGFFDSIYTDMAAALDGWVSLPILIDISDLSRWEDYPWNESVAQLIQEFYFTLDPEGIKSNEDGWLVETEDNLIDKNWLKAGIEVAGRTNMRVLDIKNADAGNSFIPESEMYDYFDYPYEFTVNITEYQDGTKEDETKKLIPTFSYTVRRQDILDTATNLYFHFFSSDRKSKTGLSDDYLVIKRFLSYETEYGLRGDNLKTEYEILPDCVTKTIIGEPPEFTDKHYYRGNIKVNTMKIKYTSNPWVVPWYNMDGATYKIVRGKDIKKSVMKQGSNEQEDKGKYFLDFTHKHNTSSDYYNWARLLMPQSKRRVEVEDLNRNFWVIGQVIAAITAYLLDPDGPYGLMIGGLLNEIMQIWENVLMMWGEIAMQTKSHPDIVVDFIYVDGSDLVRQDELYYDNIEAIIDNPQDYYETFTADGYGPNGLPYLTAGTVRHLIKNENLEYAVVKQLRKYHKEKYQDQSAILFPLLRLNNYEENYYSRLICLGYYQYCKNYEDFKDVNSTIIKRQHENVYYADAYNIGKGESGQGVEEANIFDSSVPLSKYKESFLAFTLKKDGTSFYEFDFSIGMNKDENEYTDFSPYISGIFEYDNESGYGGVNYFEFGEQLSTPNKEPVYALLMPRFLGSCQETVNGISVTLSIEICDLAKYYLTTNALVKNNQEQYEKYRIYLSSFSPSHAVGAFLKPGAINIGEDIRRYSSSSQDKGFIEWAPAPGLEFGYYMGDAITNRKLTKKIIYNLKVFGTKQLRPSQFPNVQVYKNYYGKDNLEGLSGQEKTCIESDRSNDENALTNFLKYAYMWWETGTNIDAFWTSDKLQFWNYNYPGANTIGYEDMGEGESWYDKRPIIRTREEVYNGFDEVSKRWEKQEDWQQDCQNNFTLPPDGGEMTSSTILFVAGTRELDYSPLHGEGQGGKDFCSSDGFTHHYYRNAASVDADVGAAIRMPIPGEEAEIIYYPNHVSPTEANDGYNEGFVYGASWTWRTLEAGHGPLQITRPNGEIVKDYNDISNPPYYRSQTIYFKSGNTIYSLFPENPNTIVYSTGGNGSGQYMVLRKIGDAEITPNNWRICNVHTEHSHNTRYATLKWENGAASIDKYISQAVGRESDIDYFSNEMYSAQLYRNYIRNRLQELEITLPDDFINKEVNLVKLCPWTDSEKKDAGSYDLHLKTLLFGWLRIVINGVTYSMECNPYDYNNCNEAQIEIIRQVRAKVYSNEVDEDTLWDFIDIIPEQYWGSNGKPTRPSTDNYYHMGSFNGIYTGAVNLSGQAQTEEFWYEDRVIDRNETFENYIQQVLLAQGSSYVNNWTDAIGNMLYCYQERWAPQSEESISMEACASKIEKLIFPLEGQFNNNKYVELKSAKDGTSLKIYDIILFSSTINLRQRIYVYGPRDEGDMPLYARRGIYRYSFTNNEDKDVNISDENFGKWPERPTNLHENTATNWKDDYSYTQQTIDDLRDGYEIIYVIGGSDKNYELYKSHYTKTNDDMRSRIIPEATASGDDKDYNNVLNNQKWSDDA